MDLDTALARWVFVWMGGLWVVLSLCVLLTGRTTAALVSLAVAGLYAVALLLLERQTGPSTRSR